MTDSEECEGHIRTAFVMGEIRKMKITRKLSAHYKCLHCGYRTLTHTNSLDDIIVFDDGIEVYGEILKKLAMSDVYENNAEIHRTMKEYRCQECFRLTYFVGYKLYYPTSDDSLIYTDFQITPDKCSRCDGDLYMVGHHHGGHGGGCPDCGYNSLILISLDNDPLDQ